MPILPIPDDVVEQPGAKNRSRRPPPTGAASFENLSVVQSERQVNGPLDAVQGSSH